MTFTRDDLKRVLWTVLQAGAAAVAILLAKQSDLPSDWNGWKQLGIALGFAFVAGVFSAIKNLATPTSSGWK